MTTATINNIKQCRLSFVQRTPMMHMVLLLEIATAIGSAIYQLGNSWLGVTLTLATPVIVLLLGVGVWVLYFGPASHV